MNAGRGRGRPKKTANGGPTQKAGVNRTLDPDCPTFFKSLEKQGGPIFPDICFEEIYSELYIKKGADDESEDEGT